MEFQTLASLVRSLKDESSRHLKLETEAQTEMEHLNAQMRSTRTGLGKLGELLADDVAAVRNDLTHALQAVQVDCIHRVEELTATARDLDGDVLHLMARVADCQVLGDQVDRVHDALHQTKAHLLQTDSTVAQQHDVVVLRLAAHDQVAERVRALCQQQAAHVADVEARLATHAAAIEAHVQEAMETSDRRWDALETTKIRQDKLVHEVIHDMVTMRDQVGDAVALRQALHRHMERTAADVKHMTQTHHATQTLVASLTAAMETSRAKQQHGMETLETTTEMRMDALAQTLEVALGVVQRVLLADERGMSKKASMNRLEVDEIPAV
ncbi:Aste57867_9225 [Aphanomyces stellatus]|uniref:Aste57867_9225 protein n=1 Tax=Aphanomyces stellatus TaxID=120398 RepID=A0A485KMH5_9STRA|nr:hypothetical protein As57867_009189 [Aphanomyces stellatus]VFT86108.1 Aste57867_9225 [Aphanomyces stellatus]